MNSLENAAFGREPNLSLREQGKQDRMSRIRDAATQLLFDHPFDEITTKLIAQRARVGEATLFRYVKTKQQLLNLVYGDQLDAVLDEIEVRDREAAKRIASGYPNGGDYVSRVLRAYERRCDFYLLSPVNASLYLRGGFDITDSDSARHLEQGDRSITVTKEILEEGQREGLLNPRINAHIVAQNCHGTYIHEIDRTPVRGYSPSTIWARLSVRLEVQLDSLVLNGLPKVTGP